jgi:hypothetical protein
LTLVAVRVVVATCEGRKPDSSMAEPEEKSERKVWRLLLASFLVLFAELAFIRWIAVEVRIFAYFKNVALRLCFLVSEWDAGWFANQLAGTGRSQRCWGCCFWFECRGEREGY